MRKRLTDDKRRGRLAELGERDGWSCSYCGCGLAPGRPSTTIDEVLPLVRGGEAVAANQVLACAPCNERKQDMTGEEFAHFRATGGPSRTYCEWRVEYKRRQRAGAGR